jgi:hypothetical protein
MLDKVIIANRGEIALRVLARLPRARHQNRRRALDGRREPQARTARRRIGLHRSAAVRQQLPEHARDHQPPPK